MARRRRRSRASKFIVAIVVFASAAGVIQAVRKGSAEPAPAASAAPAAKKVIAATPASHPQQQQPVAPQRITVEPVKQQELALKPLLQVTETPTGPARPAPAATTSTPAAASPTALPGPAASIPPTAAPNRILARAETTAPNAGALTVGAHGGVQLTRAGVVTPVAPAQALAAAREQYERGEFLAARTLLNDHFVSGALPAGDRAAARELLSEISEHVIFGRRIFPGDTASFGYTVKSGAVMANIAREFDVTWELLCRINGMSDPRKMRAGQTLKVVRGPFHAVVTKKDFRMDLYLGSAGEPGAIFVTSFQVGLGANDSTPTGRWIVEADKKIKNPVYYSPRGEGVFAADDPNNPLGEYWIALSGVEGEAVGKLSYGIHGTIEPETIGKEASLGCIRLRNGEIDRVYEMLMDGKSVVVVKE